MTEVEVLAGLGMFFGCFGRAFLPFLKKQADAANRGQQIKWDKRYIWTIIFAIFISIVATMLILPSFQMPTQFVFPLAFTYGWASQDIVNKIAT
jgi:H+/Cl- antiporter ClcA